MALPIQFDNPTCRACLREQKKKYGKITIECSGFRTKELVPETMSLNLSDEQLKVAEAELDPVTWASQNVVSYINGDPVPWTPRKSKDNIEYQANMLRCTARRQQFLIGRRVGKSSHPESRLNTVDGPVVLQKLINDKNYRPAIFTYDQKEKKIITTTDYVIIPSGIKKYYKLITKLGRENLPANTHPYLTLRNGKEEWVKTEDLTVGDYIAVSSSYENYFSNKFSNIKIAKFFGYFIGNGSLLSDKIVFTDLDKKIIKDFIRLCKQMNCYTEPIKQKNDKYTITCDFHKGKYNNKIKLLYDEYKFSNISAKDKRVPSIVFNGTKKFIINFLGALWNSKGWMVIPSKQIYKNNYVPKGKIGISSISKEFIYDIQHLLIRLNIIPTIRYKKIKHLGKYRDIWQLSIETKEGQNNFIKLIPLFTNKKNAKIIKKINNRKSKYDVRMTKLLSIHTNPKIKNLDNADIIWDQVKDIEYLGETQCWDLTAEPTHTLIFNDIISHNTETLALKILNMVDTIPRYRIAVIMPYQKQLNELFSRIEDYINGGILKGRLKRYNKTPNHMITFTNGSKIDAHVAGPGSVASLRSISANMIVTDEADYMDSSAWDTFLPILNDHPDTIFITSSTPSGRRGKFFSISSDPNYKIWHFSSHVIPHWNEKMDSEAKSSLTTLGYIHEILADYGDSDAIAVKNKFIDASITKEKIEPDIHQSVTLMGVDWNSSRNGTRIVILEKRENKKVRLIKSVIVGSSEWTQLKSINKIFELGREYMVDWVYVDAGYGSTQYEVMKTMSMNARKSKGHKWDAKLVDILKSIDFGSSISVVDVFSNEKRPQKAKLFLVENMIRFFEQGLVEIPETEEDFLNQLRNYGVQRYNENGIPIYGKLDSDIGDHTVDAFMLALAPLTLESSLYKKHEISGGSVVPALAQLTGQERESKKDKTIFDDLDKLPDDYLQLKVKDAKAGTIDIEKDSFVGMSFGDYMSILKNKNNNRTKIRKRSFNKSGTKPGKRTWR